MINIGIIGCADIAKRFVIPNLIASGQFKIKAIASRDINKARTFTSLFGGEPVEGYDKLVGDNEIDAVYIPLPTGMHYEWIMKALENNKHVFCEKSLSSSFSQTKEIIDFARANKRTVFENFMFPFHSQIEFVKNKIAENEIGKIRLLRSSFGFPRFNSESNIRYIKELAGGALLDTGAYTLMASQVFLGMDQDVISANLENDCNEVDFFGSVILKNGDNIISQLAFGFDNFYQNNIELWGSTGKIVIERAFTSGPGFSPRIIIEKQGVKQEFTLPPDNHFLKILNSFAECIQTEYFDYQFDQILDQSLLIEKTLLKANFS